ncbi:ion channel [Hyphococcus sp.]|uniref:ion channel n=1 Tax=Hyphococcus sp. TaxID=2038636 RepID=UPI0035C671EA
MEDGGIFHQLAINSVIISATTFVHGVFVAAAAAVFRAAKTRTRGAVRFLRDTAVLVALVLWLMLAHMIEIGMWAGLFHVYDMFDNWETSLYFAGASFTTLGFGDVLLPQEWRLLAGAAASNGLLLFGLSAAFLFDVVGKLHLGGRRD